MRSVAPRTNNRCRKSGKYESHLAFHYCAFPAPARRDQKMADDHHCIMVNTFLPARKRNIIEQSLTEILAFSAHVAWRSVLAVWLACRCGLGRARRLQP
jgi:hypothetical protein